MRALPSNENVYQMILMYAKAAEGAVKSDGARQHIGKIITDINSALLHEAKRVGLQRIPKLPNPADTAAKLQQFITFVTGQIQDPTSDIGRDAKSEAGRF